MDDTNADIQSGCRAKKKLQNRKKKIAQNISSNHNSRFSLSYQTDSIWVMLLNSDCGNEQTQI